MSGQGVSEKIRVPGVAHALAGARVAALAGLAATGTASALQASLLAGSLRLVHALLGEALLAICVAELAVCLASATYRASPMRWLVHVTILGLAMAGYVLGSAAGPGEAGDEGRAHFARAFGLAPATAAWAVLGAHVVAAALVAGLGVFVAAGLAERAASGRGARAVAIAATLALACAFSLPSILAAREVPAIAGAEAIHAPWPARAVSVWERTDNPIPAAVALAVVGLLVALPLLDRGESAPVWRRVAAAGLGAGALAFALLTMFVSLSPPGH